MTYSAKSVQEAESIIKTIANGRPVYHGTGYDVYVPHLVTRWTRWDVSVREYPQGSGYQMPVIWHTVEITGNA